MVSDGIPGGHGQLVMFLGDMTNLSKKTFFTFLSGMLPFRCGSYHRSSYGSASACNSRHRRANITFSQGQPLEQRPVTGARQRTLKKNTSFPPSFIFEPHRGSTQTYEYRRLPDLGLVGIYAPMNTCSNSYGVSFSNKS